MRTIQGFQRETPTPSLHRMPLAAAIGNRLRGKQPLNSVGQIVVNYCFNGELHLLRDEWSNLPRWGSGPLLDFLPFVGTLTLRIFVIYGGESCSYASGRRLSP